jgi:hypothetical protein
MGIFNKVDQQQQQHPSKLNSRGGKHTTIRILGGDGYSDNLTSTLTKA